MVAYPKTYEVTGKEYVWSTAPGEKFTLEEPPMWKHDPSVSWLNEQALIDGGQIRLVTEAKTTCPICVESGTKAAAKQEYTGKQLAEHHAKEHPGYQAPEEG